jgi:hypothetical protein
LVTVAALAGEVAKKWCLEYKRPIVKFCFDCRLSAMRTRLAGNGQEQRRNDNGSRIIFQFDT